MGVTRFMGRTIVTAEHSTVLVLSLLRCIELAFALVEISAIPGIGSMLTQSFISPMG